MKTTRAYNASRNIFFGSLLKVYQILIPFLLRTVMIYYLGIEYVGLNSLFVSILQVLNLAELGVGGAMVYGMYKPITDGDTVTICALMRMYKIYYRVIGIIIFGLGLILLPIIPNLISGGVPTGLNIYVLYLLNLFVTVLSYWLFAYKNSLLNAHQRNDIASKITIITNTLQYLLQFIVLCLFKNYYYYLIISLITQILNNILIAWKATKIFPQYVPYGTLDKKIIKEINQRVKDLFTAKLGGTIVNSADSVVISAFLGLTVLAIYNNYYYILTSIISFIAIIFNSCMAGIGHSIIVESKEKIYADFKKFTFIVSWISGVCTICLLCLYQPFMEIWIGKDFMLDYNIVICICLYFYIYELNQMFCTYKDAAGIWHEDRFRPLTVAICNLGLNIILVQFIGLYGVLLSTVITTLVIGMPWLVNNLFNTVFLRSSKEFVKILVTYSLITLIAAFITVAICSIVKLEGVYNIIYRLSICLVIPNAIYYFLLSKTNEYSEVKSLLKRVIQSKSRLRLDF